MEAAMHAKYVLFSVMFDLLKLYDKSDHTITHPICSQDGEGSDHAYVIVIPKTTMFAYLCMDELLWLRTKCILLLSITQWGPIDKEFLECIKEHCESYLG